MRNIVLIIYTIAVLLPGCANKKAPGEPVKEISASSTTQAPAGTATGVVFPSPGEFHKMLTRSNGTWTGAATMTFSPGAPPVRNTSILVNKMALGGLYQISEIKGNIMPDDGKPWTGLRVTGYDSERKLFTRAMIGDGVSAGGVAMEGPWDEATHSFTMPFKKVSSSGEVRNMKEVYTIVDENTEILDIYATDPKTNTEFRMLNVIWMREK
jgi:hypothetical protein